jgi:hypothetical protein
VEKITRKVRSGFPKGAECAYCGERRLPMEIDHVRPRCRGGIDEVVKSCVSCNQQKGTMLLHEWRAWREKHGMLWPPVASHASSRQPEHYSDGTGCSPGCEAPALTPESLTLENEGYRAIYLCPIHHMRYRVGWGISPCYFPDCPCAFCVTTMSEEEMFG